MFFVSCNIYTQSSQGRVTITKMAFKDFKSNGLTRIVLLSSKKAYLFLDFQIYFVQFKIIRISEQTQHLTVTDPLITHFIPIRINKESSDA